MRWRSTSCCLRRSPSAAPSGDSAGREDILSLLIAARFEDGDAMDDRELRDQLMTLLLAGHETTATALAWTFDLLLRNPGALARLTAEVDAGEEDELPARRVSESLRLRPVVPLAGRRLASELELDGLTLPVGTDVTPAIWLTHTRTDLYPSLTPSAPSGSWRARRRPTAGFPSAAASVVASEPRFAEFEMRVVLETVLRERTLEPASARAERVTRRNVTFSPRHGTRVRAVTRVAAPRRERQPVSA